MKIYKSNLSELIAEIGPPGPFYLSNCSILQHKPGDPMLVRYQVTVAGFNAKGYICELLIASEWILQFETDKRKTASHEINDSELEIKNRLAALNYTLCDGRISDDPVLGSID